MDRVPPGRSALVTSVLGGERVAAMLRNQRREMQVAGAFPVGTNPDGLAFDGANMWVTNQNSNTVSKL